MKWRAQDLCSSFTLSLSRLMVHRGWQVTGVRQQVGRLKPPSGNVKADHAHPAPPALNLLCPPFSKASAGVFFFCFFFELVQTQRKHICLKMFSLSAKLKQFHCVSRGSGLLIACQFRQIKLRCLFITHFHLTNMSVGARIEDGVRVPVY